MRECRLDLIRAGACRHPEAMTRSGAGWGPATFPSIAGLIRHPTEGVLLFDTGYDPAFLAATESFPERFYRWITPVELKSGDALVAQLFRHGITPDAVRLVILSHFHGDHAAGLKQFPAARIACAREGLAAVRRGGAWEAVRRGYLRALIPDDIDDRATFFEDLPRALLPAAFAPFNEGADILGDGSLIATPLPGHCPGHWGLALMTQDGPVFLVGDAAWSTRAIRENAPPPRLTTAFLGSTAPYRSTLARLNALSRRNPEVRLAPAHCSERAAECLSLDP